MAECGQQGRDAAAVVVRSQPINCVGVRAGIVGVSGIAEGRGDRVEVRHQRQRLPGRVGSCVAGHDVPLQQAVRDAVAVEPPVDQDGRGFLFEGRGGRADQLPQQVEAVGVMLHRAVPRDGCRNTHAAGWTAA